MRLDAQRSPDGRLRTSSYKRDGGERFCVSEETLSGTLVTEFKNNGEVVNQVYADKKGPEKVLAAYLGTQKLSIKETDAYEHVKVRANCTRCGNESIERAMDQQESGKISEVPVVPLFVCKRCKTRFYSMSDEYLKHLVSRKESLFEADEVAEQNRDESRFVHTLQEYIIRIFASKKIERLRVRD